MSVDESRHPRFVTVVDVEGCLSWREPFLFLPHANVFLWRTFIRVIAVQII